MKHYHLPTALLFTVTSAFGNFVSVYDYFNGLTQPITAQSGSELWTFFLGDENGTLMPVLDAEAYGYPANTYSRFGIPREPGAVDLSGFAGTNDDVGIFVHTAPSGFNTAVFTAPQDFQLSGFAITYEMVIHGNQSNGIGVTVRTVIDGIATDQPRFVIAPSDTVSQSLLFDFGGAGLDLSAGDKIAILFDSNGVITSDHGFFNVSAIPEPNASFVCLILLLAGVRRSLR